MEKSVREFYFNCEVCQQIKKKTKKNVAVYHIPSSRPKERFVIDAVNLSDYIANEDRYLITMIDHFSKYGWAKLVKNKSADLVLLTIKHFFTFYGFPEILQSDNRKEFVNQKVENYLSKNNIKFIHGRPYHPQSQGSVEAFNKYNQNALISAKDHNKDKFNLEEVLQDFLIYYNSKEHSTTKFKPFELIWSANNENLIQKAIKNREKSRKKGKEYVEVFEQNEVVRISNFIKINKEKMHTDSLNLRIAKKTMKENWKIKAKVIMQKRDYFKVKIILNKGEHLDLQVGTVWSIASKAIFKIK